MKKISFGLRKETETGLYRSMQDLGVFEEDLEETFILSGKKGGQNANKLATKVRLKHILSGIVVTYSKERSQLLNRFFARRILLEKILQKLNSGEYVHSVHPANRMHIDSGLGKLISKAEKIKKQKAKRKKRSSKKYSKDERDNNNRLD